MYQCLLSFFFFITFVAQATVKLWDNQLKDLILSLDRQSFCKLIHLPRLMGSAVSEYQVSGAFNLPASQWAHWENQSFFNGKPTIHNHDRSEDACNFWNFYKDDIALMQEMHINTFRFSLDWSAIEPVEGVIDFTVLEHYMDLIQALLDAGIEPMITLHHFSHPQWFEEKGGFLYRKNIHYFINFCKLIFGYFGKHVHLWCTINEVGPFAFQGYVQGVFPPGEQNVLHAFAVIKNMLRAHKGVYKALKKMPYGKDAQIGLVHQYLTFEAHDQSWKGLLNPLEQLPVQFMNYIFNDAMLYALKNDVIFPYIPTLREKITGLSQSYDFIGLNFYSRVVIESQVKKMVFDYIKERKLILPAFPSCRENEVMTDMDYPICPESFYHAIMDINTFGVPIYITENGIADANDDRREQYIRLYLFALSQAIKDGANVAGYYYWSFMDNFEWNEGWPKKFGLFAVDQVTKKRELRHGAKIYQELLYHHKMKSH